MTTSLLVCPTLCLLFFSARFSIASTSGRSNPLPSSIAAGDVLCAPNDDEGPIALAMADEVD